MIRQCTKKKLIGTTELLVQNQVSYFDMVKVIKLKEIKLL